MAFLNGLVAVLWTVILAYNMANPELPGWSVILGIFMIFMCGRAALRS
ncbi:hypothetical protein [Yersinia phage MHG19]|nr:hypothetical protein [Yersinia phage MHG19]